MNYLECLVAVVTFDTVLAKMFFRLFVGLVLPETYWMKP